MVLLNAPGVPRYDDVIPRPESICCNALFSQNRSCSTFDDPHLHLPFFVGGLHLHKGVRITPNKLLQRPFDLYGFAVDVSCRGRMVREGRASGQRQKGESTQCEQDRQSIFHNLAPVLFLSGRSMTAHGSSVVTSWAVTHRPYSCFRVTMSFPSRAETLVGCLNKHIRRPIDSINSVDRIIVPGRLSSLHQTES